MTAALKARLDDAETFHPLGAAWPAPDMRVLNAGRRDAPVMPETLFGPAWGLLSDMAEGAGAPVEYVAIGFLTAVASLIGGKRKVQPYDGADWREPCILWAGLVGDPSSGKSPALDRVTEVLREMEQSHAEQHKDRLLSWQGDVERAKLEKAQWLIRVKEAADDNRSTPPLPVEASEPLPPQRRRLLVQDSTPEGLAVILSGNRAGTLHSRDELAGWLTSFDRYTPGGREFWLEAYGGRPFVIDRKGTAEPVMLPFNGVSVVGGIQPEKLADALLGRGKPDDGLVARFLWAWPDPRPFSRPKRCSDPAVLRLLYERLDAMDWGTDASGKPIARTLTLDGHAADVFEQFQHDNAAASDDGGGLYKSFCGKLPGLLLRLALVSELMQWAWRGGDEPGTIGAFTVGAAAEFIDAYAKPSALRVFGDAALPLAERNAAILARHLHKNKLHQFNARLLRRRAGLPGMREAEPFNAAIEVLLDADWLRNAGKRDGDTPGRMSSDYAVNPAIWSA